MADDKPIDTRFWTGRQKVKWMSEMQTFQLHDDTLRMLSWCKDKYRLSDESKALRVILDYIIEEDNFDRIFGSVRCLRCGGDGWVEPD